MIEEIAKEIFCTAVDEAPHAEWEHIWWEDMTDDEKKPFREAARRIIQKLEKKPMINLGDAAP